MISRKSPFHSLLRSSRECPPLGAWVPGPPAPPLGEVPAPARPGPRLHTASASHTHQTPRSLLGPESPTQGAPNRWGLGESVTLLRQWNKRHRDFDGAGAERQRSSGAFPCLPGLSIAPGGQRPLVAADRQCATLTSGATGERRRGAGVLCPACRLPVPLPPPPTPKAGRGTRNPTPQGDARGSGAVRVTLR